MPILDPSMFVGRYFLLYKEDGQRLRTRIVKVLDDFEGDLARDYTRIFFCSMKDDAIEDTFAFNESLDHINNSEYDELLEWKFKAIK